MVVWGVWGVGVCVVCRGLGWPRVQDGPEFRMARGSEWLGVQDGRSLILSPSSGKIEEARFKDNRVQPGIRFSGAGPETPAGNSSCSHYGC